MTKKSTTMSIRLPADEVLAVYDVAGGRCGWDCRIDACGAEGRAPTERDAWVAAIGHLCELHHATDLWRMSKR